MLRRLRQRDRFAAELHSELGESYEEATKEAVIDRLVKRGLVDDVRLVRALIAANRGKRAVSIEELRRRCTDRGADEAALAEFDGKTEPPMAELLARYDCSEKGRRRAFRFLASRGFGEDDILAALEQYLPKAESDSA